MESIVWLLSYLVPFLVVLTVIVFVHEIGHYLVARWTGVAVKTFSIGFGPEIAGFTDRLGTRWQLSAIPLGGYVRFVGDMNPVSEPDHQALADASPATRAHLFYFKPVWQRIAVVLAGPAANFLFTFVVLYALLLGLGRYSVPAIIEQVNPGSPAATVGIEPGDRVISVDGYEVLGFGDFQRLIATSPGREVTVAVERDGQQLQFTTVPDAVEQTDRFGNVNRIGMLGVARNSSSDDVEFYRPGPLQAVSMTVSEMLFIVDRTFDFIGDFFVGRGDPEQLGGPVRVAQVSGNIASLGWLALLNLTALLSLNIGLFNLFPIPMLDGGHLLYYLNEAARGRPLSRQIQDAGFRFGLAVVFTLMVFTLVNDLL
ncbi:MAG: RIP metalloprotease RseP [Cucumibacter sp.]